jgi:uncharacterized protein YbaP (TraB family)
VLLPIWAGSARAQYWMTRDFCAVDTPAIHAAALAPATLVELQSAAAKRPNTIGNFWQIESPDGVVSHLWGTYHSNDPIILRLPAPVLDQIAKARIVAVEIDPIAPSRRALEQRNEWAGYFRPPHQVNFDPKHHIDPVILDWMRSRAHSLGWGRDSIDNLSIGGLAEMMLYDPCNDFAFGTVPIQDGYIQIKGLLAGAKILGLEQPDEFITMMNTPDSEGLAISAIELFGAALNPNVPKGTRATSFALYQSGQNGVMQDWERVATNAFFGAPFGGEIIDTVDAYLLDARNASFLETALADLTQGGVFMAIGSFHLPGENGMIGMMRRAGFTVTRVPLPNEVP